MTLRELRDLETRLRAAEPLCRSDAERQTLALLVDLVTTQRRQLLGEVTKIAREALLTLIRDRRRELRQREVTKLKTRRKQIAH